MALAGMRTGPGEWAAGEMGGASLAGKVDLSNTTCLVMRTLLEMGSRHL